MSAQTDGKFLGYDITALEKLVLWELGQVSGTTASYSRFPRWLLRQKFTERQNQLAMISKCIKKLCLVPTRDGRRTYNLPQNCMDGGILSAKFYTSATDYVDLEIRSSEWLDENRPGWRVEDETDPEICFMGPTIGNTQTISLHPVPDTNAESYIDNLDTGVYSGTGIPGASLNIQSTCTSEGSSTECNDTAYTFTNMGLVAGMAVRDLTDGSYGKLSTIAANTLTLAAALTGGSDNTFSSGDTYIVLAGEYAVITSHEREDRYIFASQFGMLDNLTIPAHTLLIEYVPYPQPFTWNDGATDANQTWQTQYPEVPRAYHYGLAMGVVADLLRTFNDKSREFARAEAYEQRFKAYATGAFEEKGKRPFEDAGAAFRPFMRRR
jgi:hypothetical protein